MGNEMMYDYAREGLKKPSLENEYISILTSNSDYWFKETLKSKIKRGLKDT